MLSKRDLQLVRLAVRWRWFTPEQGEDVLFLKRKFEDKLSIEEIIRRRAYLGQEEIEQLAEAANQIVGRRGRRAQRGASLAQHTILDEEDLPEDPPIGGWDAGAPVDRMPTEMWSAPVVVPGNTTDTPAASPRAPSRLDVLNGAQAGRAEHEPPRAERTRRSMKRARGVRPSEDTPSRTPPPDPWARGILAPASSPGGDDSFEDDRTAIADVAELEALRAMSQRSRTAAAAPRHPSRARDDARVRARAVLETDHDAPPSTGDMAPAAPPREESRGAARVGGEAEDLEARLLDRWIGPYLVRRVIARGSRGSLLLAEHSDGAQIALKVLDAEHLRSPEAIARLRRDVEKAREIDSPNVVRIVDVGVLGARPYVAMQYADAWTLGERLDSGDRPDLVESLRVALDIARALDAAEAKGVVHRDVSPDNVLVGRNGVALLTGFALAREHGRAAVPWLSDGRVIVGTPGYASPEQARGEEPDHRSDLYSLGALLLHLVTGRRLHDGLEIGEAFTRTREGAAPLARSLDESIPAAVADVIDRLLQARREDRYPCAREVVEALERAIAELQVAGIRGVAARPSARRRVLVVRALLAAAALAAAAISSSSLLEDVPLLPLSRSEIALQDAFFGALAILTALLLLSALGLIRRGELPLPMSSAWLVRLQDASGASGAMLLIAGVAVAPPAILNVLVSATASIVLASWVYGILLRRSIAAVRPDRGVGRMLAVLGDPHLVDWRRMHVPLLAMLTALATVRLAFLAYFSASAGG